MSGKSIDLAVQALKLFIHSLPEGSKFNVVSYGSEYIKLFPKSTPYNEESFKIAIEAVSTFDADLGGTEIYEPMQDVLKEEPDPSLPRHIYLLTDGAVGNTQQIVDLIKKNRIKCHVHTFGIGSGASTELIKNCALAGHGHYSFIINVNEIEQKVIETLQKDDLEYLSIKNAAFLDAEEKTIFSLPKDLDLTHSTKFNWLQVLPADASSAKWFDITFYDPNTDKESKQRIEVSHT